MTAEDIESIPTRKDGQFDRRYSLAKQVTLDDLRAYNRLGRAGFYFIPSDALAEMRAAFAAR